MAIDLQTLQFVVIGKRLLQLLETQVMEHILTQIQLFDLTVWLFKYLEQL